MLRCSITGILCDECTEEDFEDCYCSGDCNNCANAEEDADDT